MLMSVSMALGKNGTYFNILLGVVFLMSTESREVLDYEVKYKFCFECIKRGHWNKNKDRYISWYFSHEKNICSINHIPSSDSMEKAAAVKIFGR